MLSLKMANRILWSQCSLTGPYHFFIWSGSMARKSRLRSVLTFGNESRWVVKVVNSAPGCFPEGRVAVSNNFIRRGQNGLKSAQETSSRHIWGRKTLFQMRVIYTFYFFYDQWFSHIILYIHKLSHTPHILSLGSLWLTRPLTWNTHAS